MKKYISLIFILSVLTFTGCRERAEYEGTWKGEILFVNAVYIFKGNSFEINTIAGNGIMMGGGKGKIEVNGNVMTIIQTKTYYFDNDTNTGSWKKDNKRYNAEFIIDGDKMTFSPETSKLSLNLVKE